MHWLRRGGSILLFVLGGVVGQLAFSPVYRFEPIRPFTGKSWYNPFQGDTLEWSRANFHIHTQNWGGLTAGRRSPQEVISVYDSLGYTWIGLSEYQRINPSSPILLYEHGWGIGKVHQLCFWAEKVVWWDYPFFQTLSAKQHIIALLRPTTRFLVLAHPRFLHGYTGQELSLLGGYDAVEVLNRYGDSVAEWDSALSSGHYASIIASDNAHDAYNPHQVMSRWTEVGVPSSASIKLLERALLGGRTVAYKNRTPFPLSGPYPRFRLIKIEGDTLLRVQLSHRVDTLRIIGQGGTVRAVAYDSDEITYSIRVYDTYLRIEAYTSEVEAYTGALVRSGPHRRDIPGIDRMATAIQSIALGILSLSALLGGWWLLRTRADR
ncbi:MAG: hypothetical protein RMK19_01005 [Bacteroidia bacterium]|nr:hypothetical protein [Bacteroidia bacterium]MDW8014572.1 hypothetical protein [Bacteroidia bacterium]